MSGRIPVQFARLVVMQLFPEALVLEVYVSVHCRQNVHEVIARVAGAAADKELEVTVGWSGEESRYVLRDARVCGDGIEREPWRHGAINLWDSRLDESGTPVGR